MNKQGVFLVIVLMILSLFIGHSIKEFLDSDMVKAKPGPSATLKLPTVIDLVVGEPKELRADTPGKRVIWMSMDDEVKLKPMDNKGVWIYATKPGSYRITAWTSINDIPTLNEVCTVKVESEKDASDYMKQKEGTSPASGKEK